MGKTNLRNITQLSKCPICCVSIIKDPSNKIINHVDPSIQKIKEMLKISQTKDVPLCLKCQKQKNTIDFIS